MTPGARIGIGAPPSSPAGATPEPGGRPRVPRTDRITTVWLCLALVAGAASIGLAGHVPQPLWTMVHVVTLGVLSNGILQWSWYFTRALARLSPGDPRPGRRNTARIVAFNLSFLLLVASMWAGSMPGTHLGATGVGLVAAWHGYDLLGAARGALASRFAVVMRFYIASALFLVLAASLSGLVTAGIFSPDAPAWIVESHDGLVLAHAICGLGGWIGLAVGGTLVTLGPTAMRTRMEPDAVERAVRSLVPWVAGLLIAATCAALGALPGVGAGLLLVLGAAAYGVVVPLVRAAAAKGPREYAPWSMAAGLVWILVGLLAIALLALSAADPRSLRALDLPWLPIIGIGGVGQLFIGALAYLMPVVIGGGPSVVRLGIARLETWAPARLASRNTALALLAVLAVPVVRTIPASPASAGAASVCRLVLLAAFGLDVVLLARSGVAQVRAARQARAERGSRGASGALGTVGVRPSPSSAPNAIPSSGPTGPRAPKPRSSASPPSDSAPARTPSPEGDPS